MPVLGPLTYRRGSTSNLLWVFLRDADEAQRPRTGLTHDAVGATVAFLCSEAAGYITGAAIPVDGGASMGH